MLFTSFILFGCGSSSSDEGKVLTSDNRFLPLSINEQYLTLRLESGPMPEGTLGLPKITTTFSHFIGNGDVVYLQGDDENTWNYRGQVIYQKKANNMADLQVSLSKKNKVPQIKYTVGLTFTGKNAGTWRSNIVDGVSISGSFTLAPITTPENYQFRGTLDNNHEISSQITQQTYPYHVYLPEDYFTSEASYPVIFSTDGQWTYLDFSHTIESSNKNIILVAIEQGANERRVIDYALTGSEDYLRFLETEMLPLIESTYRIDNSNLALQGASWGGLLIRHALSWQVNKPLFQHFISMDGAYFNEPERYVELESNAFTDKSLVANLYLSSATNGFENVVMQYRETLQAREIQGLNLFYQSFNVEHDQVARPSLKDALIKLYP